jgi:hypothetical protein
LTNQHRNQSVPTDAFRPQRRESHELTLLTEISRLFGHLNVSLDLGERLSVQESFNNILAIDRSDPKLSIGSAGCCFSRQQIPRDLLEQGREIFAFALQTYHRLTSVSLVMRGKAEPFAKLKMLRNVMSPFPKCVHFFERNDISISLRLPVLAD